MLYWTRPEYARYVMYRSLCLWSSTRFPQSLHNLKLLQDDSFINVCLASTDSMECSCWARMKGATISNTITAIYGNREERPIPSSFIISPQRAWKWTAVPRRGRVAARTPLLLKRNHNVRLELCVSISSLIPSRMWCALRHLWSRPRLYESFILSNCPSDCRYFKFWCCFLSDVFRFVTPEPEASSSSTRQCLCLLQRVLCVSTSHLRSFWWMDRNEWSVRPARPEQRDDLSPPASVQTAELKNRKLGEKESCGKF